MRRVLAFLFCLLAAPSWALSPAQEIILLGGSGQSYYASPAATNKLPPWLSYASAGVRYYFDASGNLQTSPNNLIRNSVFAGGLSPTNMSIYSGNGIAGSIVNASIDGGFNTIDILFSGTATANTDFGIYTDGTTSIQASPGQRYIQSCYQKLISGSMTGVQSALWTYFYTYPGGAYVSNPGGSIPAAVVGVFTRSSQVQTVPATAGAVQQQIDYHVSSGTVVNFTIRIAAPQLELVTAAQTTPNAFMPTSGSAYFGPVVNDQLAFSPFTALGLRTEPQRTNLFLNNLAPVTQTITVASGTVYTVSFYGAGSIVLSGAATQTLTGAAGVRTQYSFTASSTSLTATVSGLSTTSYAQAEANAFATSPILTYGTAVTIPADNWSFTGAALAQLVSGGACIALEVLAEGAVSNSARLFELSDGSQTNRVFIASSGTNSIRGFVSVAGVTTRDTGYFSGGDFTTSARRGVINYSHSIIPQVAYDGVLGGGAVASMGVPMNLSQALLGNSVTANTAWYGWFSQILIKPSCTVTQVKAYSTANSNMSH